MLWSLPWLSPQAGLAQGKMYWTDSGIGRIQRANIDGTGVEVLVGAGLVRPYGIALDVAAGKMYWTDISTGKIQRANLDGTSVEDLITTGLNDPLGIALDVPPLIVDAGSDQEICAGQSTTIGGSPTASGVASPYLYSWAPATGLDDAGASNPTASPASTTTYTVTVTDANGRTASDEVVVTVNPLPTVTFNPVGSFFLSDPAVDLSSAVSPAGGSFSGPGVSGTTFDPAAAGVGTHTGNLFAGEDIVIDKQNTIVGNATAEGEIHLASGSTMQKKLMLMK